MVRARSAPSKVPSGVSELALAIAARTSSRLMPIEAIATGLTRIRIAGCSRAVDRHLGHALDLGDALRDQLSAAS